MVSELRVGYECRDLALNSVLLINQVRSVRGGCLVGGVSDCLAVSFHQIVQIECRLAFEFYDDRDHFIGIDSRLDVCSFCLLCRGEGGKCAKHHYKSKQKGCKLPDFSHCDHLS